MGFPVQIRDSQSNAVLARWQYDPLSHNTTVSVGGIAVARINAQTTPYTGTGDSGEITEYTITPLSNVYPLLGADWSHSDTWGDSLGGGGSSSSTDALDPSSGYLFFNESYRWQNTSTQQSGYRTTTTTLVVLYVGVPSPVTITVTATPSPAEGGTAMPERRTLRVFPGREWSVSLSAMPKPGYVFGGWYLNSTLVSTSLTYVHRGTAGAADETCFFTAVFNVRAAPYDPPAPDAPYDPNYDPATDPNWPEYSFIVVYTDSTPDGVATTTPNGITYVGYTNSYKVVTCTATRNSPDGDGYEFIRWTGSTQAAITQSKYADGSGGTMQSSLKFPSTPGEVLVVRFTAHYKKISTYKVTTTPEPLDGGATAGDGEYALNEICTVVAAPERGHKFLKWKDEGGSVVSRSATYSFAVTRDIDLTALFHFWTNLILRSASSGDILHGSGDTILRDA